MYLVYGKPMDTFRMKRAASMFRPITEAEAVKRLLDEGVECQKLTSTTWILINSEPRQVKDAIKIATLESEENDSIPKRFFHSTGRVEVLVQTRLQIRG